MADVIQNPVGFYYTRAIFKNYQVLIEKDQYCNYLSVKINS